MVTLDAPEVAKLLAAVDFDWVFLDAEHGPLDARTLQAMLQAAGRSMPCLVRVSHPAEVPIKQALDIGAAGIIVPQVNGAAQVQQIVQWDKYAPRAVVLLQRRGQSRKYVGQVRESGEHQ